MKPVQNKLKASGYLEGKLTVFNSTEINEEFCKVGGIKSAAAIPLMKKDKCLGVVLLEHIYE